MFFAIPIASKPTWQAPPWTTVCIFLINVLVDWDWQAPLLLMAGPSDAGRRDRPHSARLARRFICQKGTHGSQERVPDHGG
jgi:hypothetical protein